MPRLFETRLDQLNRRRGDFRQSQSPCATPPAPELRYSLFVSYCMFECLQLSS